MMAITPMGTPAFWMTSPLGRSTVRRIFPTGSGSSATWRMPSAMPWIRPSSRASRSSITSDMVPRAAARSWALASRNCAGLIHQGLGHGQQRPVFLLGGQGGQLCLGRLGPLQQFLCGHSAYLPKNFVPTGLPSTIS